MATDKQPTLTAAELREIGERVAQSKPDGWKDAMQAYRDRARLYEVLEWLIDGSLGCNCDNEKWCVPSMPGDLVWYESRDAAIDALLGQGGGE